MKKNNKIFRIFFVVIFIFVLILTLLLRNNLFNDKSVNSYFLPASNSELILPKSSIINNDESETKNDFAILGENHKNAVRIKTINSILCSELPKNFVRSRFNGTLIIDSKLSDQDYYLYALNDNFLEFSLLNESKTNKISAGATYNIQFTQETIILIKNIDGECLSSLMIDQNLESANLYSYNIAELDTILNTKEILKQNIIDIIEEPQNNVFDDSQKKTPIDKIGINVPLPEFSAETLTLMLDVAFEDLNFISLEDLYFDKNYAISKEYVLRKWEEDVLISFKGDIAFENKKNAVQSVIDLNRIIDSIDLKIIHNIESDSNFQIISGSRDYLNSQGAPKNFECWTWDVIYYRISGSIGNFRLFINNEQDCVQNTNHYIQQGLMQGLGLTGLTNRYILSMFHSTTKANNFLQIDMEIVKLLYHPILYSRMIPVDIVNVLLKPEQLIKDLDVVNKYAPYNSLPINSVSQKKYVNYYDFEIDYLIEIGLGREFTKDSMNLVKWEQDIRIHLEGDVTDEILDAFIEIITQLNDMTPSVNILLDSRNPNYNVYVGKRNDLGKINPFFFLQNLNARGLASIWSNNNFQILHASALIINDDLDSIRFQEIRNTLLEEITQGLGLLNDSYRYPSSIFYELELGLNDFYSSLDKKIISMMYDVRVKSGMTENLMRQIFTKE